MADFLEEDPQKIIEMIKRQLPDGYAYSSIMLATIEAISEPISRLNQATNYLLRAHQQQTRIPGEGTRVGNNFEQG